MGKSNNPLNPNRKADKGGMRSKSTIMRLNTAKGGAPIRDREGKIIGGTLVMNNQSGGKAITGQARIAPDRRWFGNTRVIGQNELDTLREKVSVQKNDPYSVVLRRKKIPMTLLQDNQKVAKLNVLENESFESTFGSKNTRKRPKLSETITDYEALMRRAQKSQEENAVKVAKAAAAGGDAFDGAVDAVTDDLFAKGQSKRIWGELYKVLDCSDVILEIVDARNIPGTRCYHIEKHLKKNASHKQLVIIINKCDLVPSWATRKWIKILSAEYPTIAFHASLSNSFGKGALITLLRQFTKLHSDKRQISVGVIGYPNTGKSSIINTLMGTKCCKAAPVPGETKVWQYVTLTKKIYMIDSPGVVYDVGDDETEIVLKGVVRSERLKDPCDFVAPMLSRLNPRHVEKVYSIKSWENDIDFLNQLAKFKGKLLPNGEPDVTTVAKIMINDWQRGKLPYFVAPPRQQDDPEEEGEEGNGAEGEEVPQGFDENQLVAAAEDEEEEDEEDDGSEVEELDEVAFMNGSDAEEDEEDDDNEEEGEGEEEE